MAAIYLSYDDGPGPYTPRLLDILAAHGARATFYVLGAHLEAAPALAARMVSEGHTLGNHTYSHRLKHDPAPSPIALLDEIERTDELIRRARGAHDTSPIPFRLPHGPQYGDSRLEIITGLRRTHAHWTQAFFDWLPRTAAEICADIQAHLRAYAARDLDAVLLLHDYAPEHESFRDRSATVEATRLLLEGGVSIAAP